MKNTKKEDKNTDKNIQVNKVVEVQVNDAGEKLITLSDNANFVTFSYPNLEVQLDMYVDIPDTFLGKTGTTGGTFAVMLNKYNNDSTFFDINNFISKKVSYKNDFLTATSWVDAGTVMPFRYETFTQDPLLEFSSRTKVYTSNIIFVANGYTRTLEDNDLELLGYVYDIQTNNVVTLLTSQPIKQYQEGQTEYLNFCLKDMYHGQGSNDNIGLQYNYYTYSGEEITSVNKQLKGKNELFVINTIQLSPDLSEVEEEFEKEVGYFTVGLLKESVVISNKLRYDVISNCSNKLQEFAFLNRLGGWESYNFNGEKTTDLKVSRNISYRNQLPSYSISYEIQTISDVYGDETFTVKSNYVKEGTLLWLRDLALSKVVYEIATKRYILIDDFNINYSSAKDKFQVTMKYHYSDFINNKIH